MATISSLTVEKGPGRLRVAIRVVLYLALVLALLLIVAYLVVTSPGFIKRFILPRVSAAIKADVTVTEISVHPFSKILVRGLKVQAKGQEPLLTAPEVRASYSLWSILRGNLRVSEIALVSPTVTLVENPDGTSNLGGLAQKEKEKGPPPAKTGSATKSSGPLHVDIRKVTVRDATFRKIKNYAGNRHDTLEATSISLTLANLKNGQAGTLQLGAFVRMENNPPAGPAGHLQCTLNGDFSFTLSADLKPAPLTGQARLDVSHADGAFGDFDRFSAVLDCSISPTEIKQTALHFQRAGAPLGQLTVAGPFDMEKMEGRLKVELRGIDRRLLNLLAGGGALDFGGTTINSSNDIELSRGGSAVSATGHFDVGNLQLLKAGQTTPALNLNTSYSLAVDTAERALLLRSLSVEGTQNGNPLLAAHLTQPMNLAWGGNSAGAGDATLDLTVTGLDLNDWRLFVGNSGSSGNVGLTLKLSSSQSGRQLGFNLDSRLQNFSTRVGTRQMAPATVNLHVRGQATNFKQFNLGECRLQVVRENQSLAIATASGTYDATDQNADLQVTLQASMAVLSQAITGLGMNFASGTVDLKGHVTQKKDIQTVTGKLEVANLTGQSGKNQFRNFGSTIDLDIGKTPEQIQINKFSGSLTGAGAAGGTFEIAGKYNSTRRSAQLTAKLSGINQNGLRPFLEPLLAGKQLVSVTINGDTSVDYDPEESSDIKSSMQMSNLVVNDPKGQFPTTPLEAKLQVDTSIKKEAVDLRQFQMTLTPTARGKNQIQIEGKVDYAQSNAIHGNLKLSADSLDLTSYYDLFGGGSKSGAKSAPTAAPEEAAPANQEPPAKSLPFKNFTLVAEIGKLYLHEVEVTGWQTAVNVDGGHVLVKPCKLTLNGAPVNATVDLNLAVPGYSYDVAFSADRIPLAPLVNSFAPDRKGQMGGTFTANAQLKGAGMTGASLQKNLTGQVNVGMTNLNLSVVNVRSAVLKKIVNVVATIPELLSSPQSAIASLMGQVTGSGGGLMDTLQKSPIQIISARAQTGGGQITLQQSLVQSTAFTAEARGAIALAQVLTNSTINIPVTVSVSQPIAKQLNLTSGNTSANGTYVALPQFLTMTGTLGVPKADINKLALGGMTVKSLGGGLLNTATNGTSHLGGYLNQLIKTIKH